MAGHFPINHPMRPFYRVLSAVAGLYMLVFGVVGFVQTSGAEFFTQTDSEWVLGLRTNPAFAVLSIVAGAVVLGANLVGRNLAHQINQLAGVILTVVGMASLALMQTEANVFDFSMVNVIVTFILAGIFGTASLYDRVGSREAARAEEEFRSGPRTA
jgi:drug/metabolite transporter (DMT)-like permease